MIPENDSKLKRNIFFYFELRYRETRVCKFVKYCIFKFDKFFDWTRENN